MNGSTLLHANSGEQSEIGSSSLCFAFLISFFCEILSSRIKAPTFSLIGDLIILRFLSHHQQDVAIARHLM